jgi:hypothetical protein
MREFGDQAFSFKEKDRGKNDAETVPLQEHGLRVAPSTLAKLAVVGGGPPFVKFMSRVCSTSRMIWTPWRQVG